MSARILLAAATALLAALGAAVQTRLAGSVSEVAWTLPLALGLVAGGAAAAACAGGRAERLLRGPGAWAAWGLACALLLLLLAFGHRYRGGLYLPGRLNPSELVKLCVVVGVAGRLVRGERGASARAVFEAAGLVAAVGALVACTGDFGLLMQLAFTFAALLFAASWLWGALAFGVLALGFAGAALCPVGHLATRFAVWRDPFADVTGAGWQTLQGLAAAASGGVGGVGFGLGDAQAVPIVASDFVYALLAEELGLVGCAGVLALWGVVWTCGLVVAARRAAEGARGEALLAAGVSASLFVQVLLNVAGVLNALPMTGITLPLVSHGGSSLAVTLVFCGVLLGLARRR